MIAIVKLLRYLIEYSLPTVLSEKLIAAPFLLSVNISELTVSLSAPSFLVFAECYVFVMALDCTKRLLMPTLTKWAYFNVVRQHKAMKDRGLRVSRLPSLKQRLREAYINDIRSTSLNIYAACYFPLVAMCLWMLETEFSQYPVSWHHIAFSVGMIPPLLFVMMVSTDILDRMQIDTRDTEGANEYKILHHKTMPKEYQILHRNMYEYLVELGNVATAGFTERDDKNDEAEFENPLPDLPSLVCFIKKPAQPSLKISEAFRSTARYGFTTQYHFMVILTGVSMTILSFGGRLYMGTWTPGKAGLVLNLFDPIWLLIVIICIILTLGSIKGIGPVIIKKLMNKSHQMSDKTDDTDESSKELHSELQKIAMELKHSTSSSDAKEDEFVEKIFRTLNDRFKQKAVENEENGNAANALSKKTVKSSRGNSRPTQGISEDDSKQVRDEWNSTKDDDIHQWPSELDNPKWKRNKRALIDEAREPNN